MLNKKVIKKINELDNLELTASNVTMSNGSSVENNLGDVSTLQTTNKGSVVDAINEVFQSANNGKELIANAIGEPLSSEDTFSAMSDKINDMKSDLKQVLTDEGVSVSNIDTMASLITKVDSEFTKDNNEILNMKNDLLNTLLEKGVNVNSQNTYKELLENLSTLNVISKGTVLVVKGTDKQLVV